MAPFKLKFRMGSSRSASQEGETEILPTVTHPLLGNSTGTITSSNTTIDSELNSFGSSNDQRNLIPTNQTNIDRTGEKYIETFILFKINHLIVVVFFHCVLLVFYFFVPLNLI